MRIALIGMPGSGKSTVGSLLANLLNIKFYDSDQLIEKNTNLSVAEIFQTKGENYFRQLEKQTILQILKTNDSFVLAVGGGSIIDSEIANYIKARCFVIWLKASLNTLYERLSKNDIKRPLLKGDLIMRLNELYKQRESLYELLCDVTVESDLLSVNKTVSRINKILQTRQIDTK
jgi:shikimate kinase